jgi:putative ABC transport system permease protein
VVEVDRRSFRVAGIYQSASNLEDLGGYAPLAAVQQLAGRTGYVTAVFVTVDTQADRQTVAQAIEADLPHLAAITSVGEYAEVDQGMQMIDSMYWAISALAVGIGAIGVMNTMVMSVFERTRQIGIFRAVGWSGWRILRMVITESLILCLLAVLVGSALGMAASTLVVQLPTVGQLLQPSYEITVFLQAAAVGFAVALIGAAYPAFRAVRLSPMEALSYE